MPTQPIYIEPFRDLAVQQQRLAQEATRLYAQEVEAILHTGARDSQRIERLLDQMLGFCFDAQMLLLFKKVCRHYFRIDPSATADYVRIYREMWETEPEAGDA